VARPWPVELIGVTVRSVFGVSDRAETEVAHTEALFEPQELEARLDDALAAIRRASDSLERHAEVLETLTDSLPALTESVTRLTEQLGHVMQVTAPLAAAEREASRLDRILRRRAQSPVAQPEAAAEQPPAEEPPSEPPASEQPRA
jgi:chromosome segregation ATPase